jgi:hypothetical protein
MSFTDDKHIIRSNEIKSFSDKGKTVKLAINHNNPMAQQDYALVIRYFEIEAANINEEEYSLAYHYKDVYSTRNFSGRVQEQLNYYPGMHQSSAVPKEDPAYTEANQQSQNRLNFWNNAMDNPDSFMSALRDNQQDFDYRKIFGSDTSAKTKAEQVGKMLSECIPCFDRILDLDGLIPDGDLLEVHALNIKMRTDILDQIRSLFKNPGMYLDICELLDLLSGLCPQDLFAMLILFTNYLAKLNLDVKFNIDFIINLIGAILSPFLDALSQWLDKLVQMLVAPMLCVIDKINEVIITAQHAKIPLSEGSMSVDGDVGVAFTPHQNFSSAIDAGLDSDNLWADGEMERFSTPDNQKYNPQKPEWPDEENALAVDEMKESINPSISEAERQERDEQWADLRQRDREKRSKIPPPLKRGNPRDGTRWSKDDVPQSDKWSKEFSVGNKNNPPEKQSHPQEAHKYFDPAPLVGSIVQVRNMTQGAIRYVQDWFDYAIQMMYDLLGTDFGWMSKKTGSSAIKSRIIQLIAVIKSIIEAISKNGLKCGVNSNFDEGQMKFILEDVLRKHTNTRFKVRDDGSIEVTHPGTKEVPSASKPGISGISTDDSSQATRTSRTGIATGVGSVTVDETEQKSIKSGIIVKNCLQDVTGDELSKANEFIAEYERRTTGNG